MSLVLLWFELLAAIRGPMLRVKVIVRGIGPYSTTGSVFVHGVRHIFHPAVELRHHPRQRTRLVFITREFCRDGLQRACATGKPACAYRKSNAGIL